MSQLRNGGTELNRELSIEGMQTAEKHLTKCSTPPVIGEIQVRMSLWLHLTSFRVAKSKWQLMLTRLWNTQNTYSFLVGVHNCTVPLGISVEVLQENAN